MFPFVVGSVSMKNRNFPRSCGIPSVCSSFVC